MSNALFKDTLRAIRKNFSRYVSIMLIIAVGTMFFVGIKITAPDMFTTAEKYFRENNLMDIRVQSSAGLTDDDVRAILCIPGVEYVSGQKFADALVKVNGEIEVDIDGTQISTRAYSISPENISNYLSGLNDGSYINRPELLEGRYPTSVNECLVDDSELSTPDSYRLGSTITLTGEGDSDLTSLNTRDFVIVGVVRSPYYLSFERGNTTIGSGKVGTFIYIPEEAFTADYYSEIYVTVQNASTMDPYSDEYFAYVQPVIEAIESISDEQTQLRAITLKPQLEQTIAETEEKIESSSSTVSDSLKELDETIATLEELVNNGPEALAKAQQEFDTKFADAQNAVNNGSAEYNAAIATYSQKLQTIAQYQQLYNQKNAELQLYKSQYDTVAAQCQSAQNSLNTAKATLATTQSMIEAGEAVLDQINDTQVNAYNNEQIQAIISMMQVTYPDLYNSVRALTAQGLAGEVAVSLAPYLAQQKAVLAQQEQQINEKQAVLDQLTPLLEQRKNDLTTATLALAQAKGELDAAEAELAGVSAQLQAAGYDVQSGAIQLQISKMEAETKLNELKTQVASAPENLAKAKQKRAEALESLDSGLLAAEEQLSAARELYSKLDSIKWSVYNRDDTPGYASYGQSVSNIRVLSNIFPIFFFLISSMICLTTMTRMVEEDRVLLGTYKALGYTSRSITLKYVIYSLSACLFGSLIGIALSVWVFPYAINSAYSIMYSLPDMTYLFPWQYAGISLLISLACTTLVTMATIFRELRLRPAVLMRPKAPKEGKRILLERIGFIWNKLNFSRKVTMRNLFRNKQRFLMTLLGIAGCTALLLASLGMYNSISAIITKQYKEDPISEYDFEVVFSTHQSAESPSYEFTQIKNDARVESALLISMKSMTGSSARSDKTLETYVLVPAAPAELNEYVDLRGRTDGQKYVLDDSGAIITEKLADDTKTDVGEDIVFTDGEGNSYSVTVSAVVENYTFHYIYMTPAVYQQATGAAPVYGYAMGKIAPSIKASGDEILTNAKGLLATDVMKIDGVTAMAYTSDTTNTISRITDALSLVILIFFLSALVLAFIVLYNLSNINIIERTRELATLKVLGFVDREISRYIYRENVIISLFGILFGLALGIGLHSLLIRFTAIDTVMYGQDIEWYSYLIALGITVMIIVSVNLVLHQKLKKVDMVLSLKSVE